MDSLKDGEPKTRDFIAELNNATLVQVKYVNKRYFVAIHKRNVSNSSKLLPDFFRSTSLTL